MREVVNYSMRCLLLFLFVSASYPLCAQHKVSELLANEKIAADSMMRIQYGSAFFAHYFIFDSASGGNFDSRGNQWNESVEQDSASYYYISYLFQFPGALTDSFTTYDFYCDSNYRLTRGSYGDKYFSTCINVSSGQMNSITQNEFRQPLSECTVRLYRFLDFDDSLYSTLDSSHVFLETEHDSIRYFGRHHKHYELWRTTIVVDACTGLVVSRSSLYFRNKNYRESGPFPCGTGM